MARKGGQEGGTGILQTRGGHFVEFSVRLGVMTYTILYVAQLHKEKERYEHKWQEDEHGKDALLPVMGTYGTTDPTTGEFKPNPTGTEFKPDPTGQDKKINKNYGKYVDFGNLGDVEKHEFDGWAPFTTIADWIHGGTEEVIEAAEELGLDQQRAANVFCEAQQLTGNQLARCEKMLLSVPDKIREVEKKYREIKKVIDGMRECGDAFAEGVKDNSRKEKLVACKELQICKKKKCEELDKAIKDYEKAEKDLQSDFKNSEENKSAFKSWVSGAGDHVKKLTKFLPIPEWVETYEFTIPSIRDIKIDGDGNITQEEKVVSGDAKQTIKIQQLMFWDEDGSPVMDKLKKHYLEKGSDYCNVDCNNLIYGSGDKEYNPDTDTIPPVKPKVDSLGNPLNPLDPAYWTSVIYETKLTTIKFDPTLLEEKINQILLVMAEESRRENGMSYDEFISANKLEWLEEIPIAEVIMKTSKA